MTSRKAARRHRGRNAPRRTRGPRPTMERINPYHWDEGAEMFWRDHIDEPLFVYFIQAGGPGAGNGPVKIGKALNPQKRLAELQCGNPDQLYIKQIILAGVETESTLHTFLRKDARVRGEWFGRGWENLILAYANAACHRQIDMYLEGSHPLHCIDKAQYMAVQLIRREAA